MCTKCLLRLTFHHPRSNFLATLFAVMWFLQISRKSLLSSSVKGDCRVTRFTQSTLLTLSV